MRAKIALIVVLASFLALSALGVGMAGADPLSPSTPLDSATTTTEVPALQAPACANGLDDDGDGLIDLADPDCVAPEDVNEATEQTEPTAPVVPPPATQPPAAGPSETESGASIGGKDNEAQVFNGGVNHNESLGDASGGGGDGGGVSAPSATGNGDQPLADEARRRLAVLRRRQPDRGQPDDDDRAVRPGPDRRPQLRHRLLRDPPLPAADLPGLRDRIRHPLGGAGLDQQNRDRLRHQPQRLQRRRRRLDAVPALELGGLRGRRQRRRPQRPLQPGRCDLRRRQLPRSSPAATRTSTTRSSPTTTPTGTCRRCCCTRGPTGNCPPTWSAR